MLRNFSIIVTVSTVYAMLISVVVVLFVTIATA